ncbi:MAG TPA: hypothetical protein PL123_08585 [Bacteroidales bacterium]|nr:hypothetical protein [Bacteroidales bacterium]
MKKYISLIYLGLISVSLLVSCEKKKDIEPIQYETIEPVQHETREIDINQDLINDFKISYSGYTWDGIGPNGTGMGIGGYLIPLSKTVILKKLNSESLFSRVNDTIKQQMSQPYSWDSTKLNLVSIKTSLNKYVNPWVPNSAEIKDFYYIAFKISVDDRDILGWMKISIDKYTGLIDVKASQTSEQDFITIGNQ